MRLPAFCCFLSTASSCATVSAFDLNTVTFSQTRRRPIKKRDEALRCVRAQSRCRGWRPTAEAIDADRIAAHLTAEPVPRADRLDFRPKHRLTVLVAGQPVGRPADRPKAPEYAAAQVVCCAARPDLAGSSVRATMRRLEVRDRSTGGGAWLADRWKTAFKCNHSQIMLFRREYVIAVCNVGFAVQKSSVCGILADVEGDEVSMLTARHDHLPWKRATCAKGRALPQLYSPP